jgi:hypothetical protein
MDRLRARFQLGAVGLGIWSFPTMRIRTIKPEFWSHPVIGRLTDAEKLLAIGLLNVADDEGFFLADETLIRNAVRPFDESSTNTRRALEALSKAGWIAVREHPEQGKIGLVVNFAKHQRIDRPTASKIATYYNSTSPRRALDEPSLPEGKGKEQGKEQGTGSKEPPAASPWLVAFDLILPEALQTQSCLEAIMRWLRYKAERKETYKRIGLEAALSKWSKEFTAKTFPVSVENSIAANWAGLFQPRDETVRNGNSHYGNRIDGQPVRKDWKQMTDEEILREAL